MTTTSAGPRIAVLIKQVPRSASDFDAQHRLVRETGLEINPCCRRALAHGVRLATAGGGESIAITLGPEQARDVLLEAQACGVDRSVHLCDRDFAGADCLATARALAAAMDRLGPFDLVLVGASSTDAATAAVAPMLAELLGLPYLSPALELELAPGPVIRARLQHDDADERVQVRGPAVVAVAERSSAPARADRESWPAELHGTTITAADLGPGPWGAAGSPTVVRALHPTHRSRTCRTLAGTAAEQAAEAATLLSSRLAAPPSPTADPDGATPGIAAPPQGSERAGPTVLVVADPVDGAGTPALIAEAARLARQIGGRVTVAAGAAAHPVPAAAAAHPVAAGAAEDTVDTATPGMLASWGADAVLLLTGTHPRPLAAALAEPAGSAWAVLAPATGWGREVLARLAVRLRTGYIADATRLTVQLDEPPHLVAHKPAGDAHLAEIVTREPQLVGVRTGCLASPPARTRAEDPAVRELRVDRDPAVDYGDRNRHDLWHALDRAPIVIGVGRGVDPADYPLLEPLRTLLHAEIAGSRPVADRGALPRGRQLGLTGRSIAPRLYLAIGISGSSNHVTAITRADTVLAINTDPDAPIFSHADIGVVGDWREAVPALAAALAQRQPA